MSAMAATDEFQPVSRVFTSQGLDLHYLDWGNDGAPLLLLLHGSRDHARSWDWTARALRHQWHVIAPDLRGHGDSDWSSDGAYLTVFHALDIAVLIETLGQRQLCIVGHSFGGGVAIRYAAIFPERVRKLVLVDGLGPSPQVQANWDRQGPVQRTREWIDNRLAVGARAQRRFATLEEAVARMAEANRHLSEEQARHLAVHGVRRHADGYGWKYDPRVFIFAPDDFALDSSAFWRAIAAPVLLCHGTESWTINAEEDGRAGHFRDRRTVVFENAGHWIHHDRCDAFIAALRDFL